MTPSPNAWIAIAGTGTVPAKGRIRVRLHGQEYVLWRGESGAAQLWVNRCPHRGMRLSFGFVRGDHLHCLYHGWCYDQTGACVAIPAHPDLTPPKAIRTAVLPIREVDGLIFARLGDPDPLPDLSGRAPGQPFQYCRSIYLDRPPQAALAAIEAAAPAGWRAERLATNLQVLIGSVASGAPLAVLIGCHDLDGTTSGAHASVACADAQARRDVCDYLISVRDADRGGHHGCDG